MFGRIAQRYDLLNRLMTLGQDTRWRREVIRRAELKPGTRLLDLGAGTGDLALEARRQAPLARPVAADFTRQMLALGKRRPGGEHLPWLVADAMHLPFASEAFDVVVSGFLLRNVADLQAVLTEEWRLLHSGGRVLSLDTTPLQAGPLRPLLDFHLHRVIPLLGRVVAGDAEAYNYLPTSTEHFLSAEALAERMAQAGFEDIGFARRMFGIIGIHWAAKGPRPCHTTTHDTGTVTR